MHAIPPRELQIREHLEAGASITQVCRKLNAGRHLVSRVAYQMQPQASEQCGEIVRRYMDGTLRVTIARDLRLPASEVLAILAANCPREVARREMAAGMIRRKVIDYLGIPHEIVDAVAAEIDPPVECITLTADGPRQLSIHTTTEPGELAAARFTMRGMLELAAARASRAGSVAPATTWSEQVLA